MTQETCAVNPKMDRATCHRCPIHCQGTCKRASGQETPATSAVMAASWFSKEARE